MQAQIKRVYEEPSEDDGKRILIDRLWPRGLTKEKAKIDVWLKILLQVHSFDNGSDMTIKNGGNSRDAIKVN